MKGGAGRSRQAGFTLIELLTALGIFLVVCGAAFTLLASSQQHYQTESELLTSFQEARLGLDQIVRDVNDAGYPPPTFVSTNYNLFASVPFAWAPGYTSSPCAIGTCNTPGDFDLIIETEPNAAICAGGVQWIRYQLQLPPAVLVPTLMRGTACKVWGDNPATDTSTQFSPFVLNVVNDSSAAQIAQYKLSHPTMFPGGTPVPVFSYTCDTPSATVPQTVPCSLAGPDNLPANIRDVVVTLIVASPVPDATTGQPRLVELTGRGRRVNPNQ